MRTLLFSLTLTVGCGDSTAKDAPGPDGGGDLPEDTGCALVTWYADTDGDHHGDPAVTLEACTRPAGYAMAGDDCDDGEALAWTGADEVCNDGVDNDCDGAAPGCGWPASVALDDAAMMVYGHVREGLLGTAVGPAGDQNGDGIDDLIIGAPAHNAGGASAGAVYVMAGGVTGPVAAELGPLGRITGEVSNGELGRVLPRHAPDLDGDGYADLVLPAFGEAGGASIFFGPLSDGNVVRLLSEAEGSIGPWATRLVHISTGQDLDRDGRHDVLISSGDSAYLMSAVTPGGAVGLDDATAIIGPTDTDTDAIANILTPDLNGDGVPDLALSDGTSTLNGTGTGALYLVYGPAGDRVLPDDGDAFLFGEADRGGVGTLGLVSPGDLDGDGLADLTVGVLDDTASGGRALLLVPGTLTETAFTDELTDRFLAPHADDQFGTALAGQDIDLDGVGDLVIGLAGWSAHSGGAVGLLMGPLSGTRSADDLDALILSGSTGVSVGMSLALVGQATDDGTVDVLIGAPYEEYEGRQVGHAWLVEGFGM